MALDARALDVGAVHDVETAVPHAPAQLPVVDLHGHGGKVPADAGQHGRQYERYHQHAPSDVHLRPPREKSVGADCDHGADDHSLDDRGAFLDVPVRHRYSSLAPERLTTSAHLASSM